LLTAVLLGVLVIWMLSEFYGWHQSGLVVPGYLAGVFAIQPQAGFVVLAEAMITYGLAWAVARGLPRLLPVDRAFGRNRFFLILLISVGVRLFVEGGPLMEAAAAHGHPLESPLNSLGLVLVPLTANAMWRGGLYRGIPMVGLPTLIVFLLLEWLLLPHTNLSFAQFELTYEDLSRDFISSPRAYMLLLTGALLATHMAIRYGWDSGGIIIPGLLAITWIHPDKLLATIVEVAVIVFLLRVLLRVPPLRTANLTGLRPLILAFVIGYLVKLLLSALLSERYPGLQIADLFGFGYLLPSLIAVRCWRYGSFPRVIFPALTTSLVAFVVATCVGLGLEYTRPLPAGSEASRIGQKAGPAWRAITEVALPASTSPDPTILVELRNAWRMASLGKPFHGDQLRADVYPDGVVLHSGGQNLYGSAWVRTLGNEDLAVVVPDAAMEPGLAEAAVMLAQILDARFLLLSPGSALQRQARSSGCALLELRISEATVLSIARRLPDAVDLKRLSSLIPDLIPEWDLPRDIGVNVRLTVDESTLLELATHRFDADPVPGRLPLYDPHGMPITPRVSEPDPDPVLDLLFLHRGVLLPLLLAREGDPRWARLAASQAARRQWQVAMDEHVISLGPADDADPPHFTLWMRRGVGSDMIFEVRAARRHFLTAEVARTWWAGTKGSAMLVHDAGADLDAQALQRAARNSPELVSLRALVLDAPGSTVVSVDVYREDEFPGADSVISIGRPLGSGDIVPRYLDPVRRLVEGSGGSVTWYDGDYQRIRFYDPSNPRQEVVRAAGGEYVTVFLSPLFRQRFATPGTSGALRTLLTGSGVELRTAKLEALVMGEPAELSQAQESFGPLLRSLARHTSTGHPGELGRTRRLANERGMQMWVFMDEDDGLPYVVMERHDRRLISSLTRSRGELANDPNDPAAVRLDGLSAALMGGAP